MQWCAQVDSRWCYSISGPEEKVIYRTTVHLKMYTFVLMGKHMILILQNGLSQLLNLPKTSQYVHVLEK